MKACFFVRINALIILKQKPINLRQESVTISFSFKVYILDSFIAQRKIIEFIQVIELQKLL